VNIYINPVITVILLRLAWDGDMMLGVAFGYLIYAVRVVQKLGLFKRKSFTKLEKKNNTTWT